MKLIKFLIGLSFIFPLLSLAGEDPWYKNQPACFNASANIGNTNFLDENQNHFEFKQLLWQVPVNRFTKPICYADKIFYGLNGYDIATGKIIWKSTFPEDYATEEYVIYKDHMYAVINNKRGEFLGVYDINLKTSTADLLPLGIPLNRHTFTKLLAYNNILYMTFSSGDLIAYSLASHSILWSNKNKLHSAASLTTDGNLLITEKRGLIAYDLISGDIKWHIPMIPGQTLAYQNGLIYTDTSEGIKAIKVSTGELVWNYLPDGIDSEAFRPGKIYLTKNTLFFAEGQSENSAVYALDPLTGHLKWTKGNYLITYLSKNALYLNNAQNRKEMVVVDPNTNNFQTLTSYTFSTYLIEPAISNNVMFCGDWRGEKRIFTMMK